jgi:hypothetical protein
MLLIQKISTDSYQTQTVRLDDGTSFVMTLYYVPLQYGWFITELVYLDFVVRNIRVTNIPNILYQWKNKLPFGLFCVTDGGREPSQLEDFATGVARLYVLTADEVEEYTEFLENG